MDVRTDCKISANAYVSKSRMQIGTLLLTIQKILMMKRIARHCANNTTKLILSSEVEYWSTNAILRSMKCDQKHRE